MNDLITLLKTYPNMSITVTLAVLLEFGRFLIDESRQQFEQTIADEKAETYLKPKEVAQLLDCNPSTLWRWQRKNFLVPCKCGGKRMYRQSDIDKLLKKEEV